MENAGTEVRINVVEGRKERTNEVKEGQEGREEGRKGGRKEGRKEGKNRRKERRK